MKKLFVNVSTQENKLLNKQFQFLKDRDYSEKIKCLHVSIFDDLSITIFETGDYGYKIYCLYDDCIGLINDVVKQAKLHII